MSRKLTIWSVIIGIVAIAGIVINANYYFDHKGIITSYTHEGRIYLVEQEYEDFKIFLADNPDVQIIKMDALSSPNALIDMELRVPADTMMPNYDYGYIEVTPIYEVTLVDSTFIAMFITVICCLLWVIVFTFLPRNSTIWEAPAKAERK